jgi:trimethylamine--corrinoid protein Co-methyltransferase
MAKISRAGINTIEGVILKILSDDDLFTIHQATLAIMHETGIKVKSKTAREIFAGSGCHVDHEKEIVRFPPHVVEDAIGCAPSKLLLAGRNSKDDIVLWPGKIVFSCSGGATSVIDPYTGQFRTSTKDDVCKLTLLLDALSEYEVVWKTCVPMEVPAEVNTLHSFEAMLANTTKHLVHGPESGELTKRFIEMAAAVVGGKEKLKERPIFTATASVTSPLTLTHNCCDIIIEAAKEGVPVRVLSMGLAGATIPVTLAGGLVTHNAEVLSGIILAQLVSKGTPVIYGSATTIMDLKSGAMPLGCPEQALFSATVSQLSQYYGICCKVTGAQTDSKISDCQTGHEKTITSILPALAGAAMISGGGMLESVLTFSYAQLVIDNEIFKMIKALMNGIKVNDETLALDLIKEIGPGGNFLETDHTYDHMAEQSHTNLFNRKTRVDWQQEGSKDLEERARGEAISILEKHKPEPLMPEVASELRSIVKIAEDDLVSNK